MADGRAYIPNSASNIALAMWFGDNNPSRYGR